MVADCAFAGELQLHRKPHDDTGRLCAAAVLGFADDVPEVGGVGIDENTWRTGEERVVAEDR